MIGENIKRLRKMAGHSQLQLAELVGVKQASVSRWERGKDTPEYPNLMALTDLLNCSADDILLPEPRNRGRQAPLISWVQAGEFTECFDPYEKGDYAKMVTVNTYDKPTVIALEVVGNSMDKLAPEGSIIIVDYADKELVDGKFYVLRLDGNNETTFKRYRADPMLLEPFSNGNYKPIIPDGDIEVVGRVVEVTIITP